MSVENDVVQGVTLEQYAGVCAALAEGIPLEAVLTAEGIVAATWPAAESAWKVRVAKDGPEGGVFTQLRDKRAIAEDTLARSVAPIDSDLGAWMSFLRAYGAHAEPFEMLSGQGLGLNDLARLQRRWATRMAADPGLEKQAAEIAKRGPPPLPPLRVEKSVLKPFPRTRRTAPSEAAPKPTPRAVVAPAETALAPGKLRLFSYVAVKARLAEHPGDEDRVLAELGIRDFAATDAGWTEILANDADLERDYRRLLTVQRARLRGGANAGPGGPSSPPARTPIVPSQPVPARAPNKLAGTSLAVDPPRGPALPFAAAPQQAAVQPKPASLAGTSLALDTPSKPALPFGAGAPKLGGTSLALDPPRGPVLPFGGDKPILPVVRRAPPKLGGTSLAVDEPRKPALPFEAASALTLEQHASLACEIAQAPERALETLARYQLTPAQKVEAALVEHHTG